MDAINLLMQDHQKVDGLFQQFTQGGTHYQFEQLFEQLRADLTLHTQIEENIFYPAVAKYPELADMVKEAYQEHAGVKKELEQIAGLDNTTTTWSDAMQKLMTDVKHHVAEEENEMFPKLREVMTQQHLEDLGQQLQDAKSKGNMDAIQNKSTFATSEGQSNYQS